MYWVGLPLALAISLYIVPAGARGLRDAGLVRENYRGAPLAFPLGAVLATAVSVSPSARASGSKTTFGTSPNGIGSMSAEPAPRRRICTR